MFIQKDFNQFRVLVLVVGHSNQATGPKSEAQMDIKIDIILELQKQTQNSQFKFEINIELTKKSTVASWLLLLLRRSCGRSSRLCPLSFSKNTINENQCCNTDNNFETHVCNLNVQKICLNLFLYHRFI